jgi:OmpA-OmpF porin, OOP family
MKFATTAVLAGFTATFALSSIPAMAQTTRPEVYWSDSQGQVVKDPYDLCWRAGYWTPAGAAADKEWGCKCDKDLIAKEICEPPPPPPPPAPPPPAVEPAPVKLLPKKIDFSADALFDFDKYALKPKGTEMLDELASALSGATYDSISAIGYTDPIGSVPYNQKLSERRAAAVKTYLTSKGIPTEKIATEGRGKTNLKVTIAECRSQGAKNRKALIECLQPNRRVEVSVSGTKPQ